MFLTLGLAVLLNAAAPDSSHRELYERGQTMEQFLDAARQRREEWHERHRTGTPPDELVSRAVATGQTWKLLVVADDRCGDSANTIPFVARFASAAGIELRVVSSTDGRAIMESHRTPDGRAATPTILVLDADYREVGAFIERPDTLQTWRQEQEKKLSREELRRQTYEWYATDRGRTSIAQIVGLMEAGAASARRW
jgi:hypothetical protein